VNVPIAVSFVKTVGDFFVPKPSNDNVVEGVSVTVSTDSTFDLVPTTVQQKVKGILFNYFSQVSKYLLRMHKVRLGCNYW
jgi:hypothetical protein